MIKIRAYLLLYIIKKKVLCTYIIFYIQDKIEYMYVYFILNSKPKK